MDIQLQPRDHALISAVYWIGDGFFPRRLIRPLFFSESNDESAMRKRLSKLQKENFIFWPSDAEYREWGIPEPVIFLDWRGIADVADQMGTSVEPPRNPNFKKHIAEFATRLKEKGIYWRVKPSWNPRHDLKAIDVRLAFSRSAALTDDYFIEQRIPESHFRHRPDTVAYSRINTDGVSVHETRQVIPDDFVVIGNRERQAKGESYRFRALLEIDMSTHSNPAFSSKKARAYSEYVTSQSYEVRIGSKGGRWFVITTGPERMANLMRTTQAEVGNKSKVFVFSYFALVEKQNIFKAPIWWQFATDYAIDFESIE